MAEQHYTAMVPARDLTGFPSSIASTSVPSFVPPPHARRRAEPETDHEASDESDDAKLTSESEDGEFQETDSERDDDHDEGDDGSASDAVGGRPRKSKPKAHAGEDFDADPDLYGLRRSVRRLTHL